MRDWIYDLADNISGIAYIDADSFTTRVAAMIRAAARERCDVLAREIEKPMQDKYLNKYNTIIAREVRGIAGTTPQ